VLDDTTRPRVLVVDDDDMARLLATETLEGAGFEVHEAADGEAGLAAHGALAPDLVLLDVNMPGLDGYAVCERVRARPDGGATPILVMTANDDVDAVERAFAVGATDFLTKPLNLPLLAHRVRYLLRAAQAFHDEREHARMLARVQRLARLAHWRVDANGFAWACDVGAVLWPEVAASVPAPRSLLALVHTDDRAQVEAAMATIAPHQLDYRMVLPDGSERLVRQDAEVIDDAGRPVVIGATQDVTEQRAAERRIAQLAFFDDLTGLPSRAFLHRFLRRVLHDARGTGSPVALLSIGIALGAVPGTVSPTDRDELRRAIAARVVEHVRGDDLDLRLDQPVGDPDGWSGGALLARPGSDELVVVLRDARAATPEPLATRLATALAAGYRVGDRQLFVSSPIGIATSSDSGEDPRTLIEHARAASHQARSAAPGVHRFSADMLRAARQSADFERRIRTAVAQLGDPARPPEFTLYYQPKVERGSGRTVGVEALLRWFPPDGPPVSPGEFIPVAERSNAIALLGDWLLREACAQGAAWIKAGTPIHVAVNVSPRQLRAPGFVDRVVAAAAATGFDLGLLQLEITEHATVEDFDQAAAVLHALRARGVQVVLDDFGVGQSSLAYVARLPVDVIKIDRAFVAGLGRDPVSGAIVSAVMAMAEALDITVVVEGVETVQQVRILGRYPSCEVQGFYCARPAPAAELTPFLTGRFAWNADDEGAAIEIALDDAPGEVVLAS